MPQGKASLSGQVLVRQHADTKAGFASNSQRRRAEVRHHKPQPLAITFCHYSRVPKPEAKQLPRTRACTSPQFRSTGVGTLVEQEHSVEESSTFVASACAVANACMNEDAGVGHVRGVAMTRGVWHRSMANGEIPSWCILMFMPSGLHLLQRHRKVPIFNISSSAGRPAIASADQPSRLVLTTSV